MLHHSIFISPVAIVSCPVCLRMQVATCNHRHPCSIFHASLLLKQLPPGLLNTAFLTWQLQLALL